MAAVSPPALQAVGPAAYLQALLAEREAPYYLRLQRRPLEKVYARLVERTPDGGFFGGEPELTRSLLGIVDDLLGARNTLQAHLVAQETLIRDADDRQAHRMLVLETARVLGAGPLALRADAQALGRDLDWPGMRERAKHRVNTLSRTLQATLIVLRNLVAVMGETEADRLNLIEELMLCALSLLDQPQHPLLARESVRFAGEVLRLYGAERALPHKRLEEELLVRARDPRRDVWVQCHALQALAATAPDAAQALVERRLTPAEERFPDTLFVRRYVLDRLAEFLPAEAGIDLLARMLETPDPSPHVRQGVLLAICALPLERSRALLERQLAALAEEPVAQVRAALPVGLAPLTREAEDFAWWDRYFELERDATSLQIGLALLSERLDVLLFEVPELVSVAESTVLRALARGHRDGWPLPILRQVEELLERIRVVPLASYVSFKRALLSAAGDLQPGDWFDLVATDGDRPDQDELGRLLAWFSQGREGLYAFPRREGYRVSFGFRYVLRAWRLWHETKSPAPDKRPAYSHVRGRYFPGTLRAHSTILGEQSPTKVPGEPVVITSEGGWRSFLPLLDDFLDALKLGQLRLFSPQGVVTITPPHQRQARWRAWWRLTVDYPQLAGLRDQCRLDNPEVAPSAFVDALRGHGFDVHFHPHPPPGLSTALRYFNEDEDEPATEEPAIVSELLGPKPQPESDTSEVPATERSLEATQPLDAVEAAQPLDAGDAEPEPPPLELASAAPGPAVGLEPDGDRTQPIEGATPSLAAPSAGEDSGFMLLISGPFEDHDATQPLFAPSESGAREPLAAAWSLGDPAAVEPPSAPEEVAGADAAPADAPSPASAEPSAGDGGDATAALPLLPPQADAGDATAHLPLLPPQGDEGDATAELPLLPPQADGGDASPAEREAP